MVMPALKMEQEQDGLFILLWPVFKVTLVEV
ncbi:uncharacterized protein FIBRA_08472 [Fibroporia radiculosa]|uniref:Uncharacterized protein n=1 Tax=Fibroporia radiculosa TaxID=599839 RepID=J4ICD6_9APHY|nr:uncharacterized protein FIBRA_08472 [Fibroporia radiculosa]CCM06226.1 predicted protein [Fibroporia radiculosa]